MKVFIEFFNTKAQRNFALLRVFLGEASLRLLNNKKNSTAKNAKNAKRKTYNSLLCVLLCVLCSSAVERNLQAFTKTGCFLFSILGLGNLWALTKKFAPVSAL